ncbi:MAG: acetyl-CoA hydrolase/transferase family protein [Oligoflexia bacterium]|nr:acetyl-CoA hydrolase/transferase family protein [Oligoflexia bacterium]
MKQAIEKIKSNQRVFIQGAAATPLPLVQELVNQAPRLKNVEIIHMHTEGPAPYAQPEMAKHFRVSNLFVGGNIRKQINFDSVDYIPCFLSEMDLLFRKDIRRPNVALVQVSPPDKHGNCSLGTSVDITKAAVETADLVIALVNPQVPRVFGDGIIPFSQIDEAIEYNGPLIETKSKPLTEIEIKIGNLAAEFIEDNSTLQIGIGSIPDAVLAALKNHKNLGVHSEMWSDGLLPLLKSGVVNNSKKNIYNGKTIASFLNGSKELMDFVNDNPSVMLLEAREVNNPRTISKNDRMVSINSAVEIDLSGQVCADSVGARVISGVGGQVDFIRGATLSKGGKSILALTSRSRKANSRIVSVLQPGAGIVTTRAHVHHVVTEYGHVELFGKTVGERAKALIGIAHPDDRESLERQFFEIYKK